MRNEKCVCYYHYYSLPFNIYITKQQKNTQTSHTRNIITSKDDKQHTQYSSYMLQHKNIQLVQHWGKNERTTIS